MLGFFNTHGTGINWSLTNRWVLKPNQAIKILPKTFRFWRFEVVFFGQKLCIIQNPQIGHFFGVRFSRILVVLLCGKELNFGNNGKLCPENSKVFTALISFSKRLKKACLMHALWNLALHSSYCYFSGVRKRAGFRARGRSSSRPTYKIPPTKTHLRTRSDTSCMAPDIHLVDRRDLSPSEVVRAYLARADEKVSDVHNKKF